MTVAGHAFLFPEHGAWVDIVDYVHDVFHIPSAFLSGDYRHLYRPDIRTGSEPSPLLGQRRPERQPRPRCRMRAGRP